MPNISAIIVDPQYIICQDFYILIYNMDIHLLYKDVIFMKVTATGSLVPI